MGKRSAALFSLKGLGFALDLLISHLKTGVLKWPKGASSLLSEAKSSCFRKESQQTARVIAVIKMSVEVGSILALGMGQRTVSSYRVTWQQHIPPVSLFLLLSVKSSLRWK